MKDSWKLIFGIGCVCLGYLVNYLTISALWLYFLILVLFLLFLIPNFEFQKVHFRYQKDLLFSVIICVLSYFLVTYVSGIFFGFRKNIFHLNFDTLSTFFLLVLGIGIITEIIRYVLLRRYQNNTLAIVLLYFFFVFIDILPQIVPSNFSNFESILGVLGLVILPVLFENLLFCYLSLKIGYGTNLFYKVMMRGSLYFLPILPNYNDYLSSVLKIVFPILILWIVYQQFQEKRTVEIRRNPLLSKLWIVSVLFFLVVIGLVSGYFHYFALTIGSMSMSPTVEKGDILIIEKTKNLSNISEGSILAFQKDGNIVVHRVINKITKEDQSIYFQTQGDSNPTIDPDLVSIKEVIGVARLKIKYLGLPTIWLNESLK